MNNTYNRQVRNLTIQIYSSYLFILTILLSIGLLYNERNYLKNGDYFINKQISYYISYYTRIFSIGLVLVFLIINIDNKEIVKENGLNTKNSNLQIFASLLNVIASIIVFYVIFNSGSSIENITDVENPII